MIDEAAVILFYFPMFQPFEFRIALAILETTFAVEIHHELNDL